MIAFVAILMLGVVLSLVLRPLLIGPNPGRPVWAVAVIATLGLALGAYLAMGKPGLASQRAAPPAPRPAAGQSFAEARETLLKNPGDVPAWLRLSMGLGGMGQTQEAAEALAVALKAMPDNPDLWVGYGEALTAHAGGQITPAARLAFDRANQLAPGHPAPKFYLALAWMQGGQPREALAVLEELERTSKPDAPWMPRVQAMIRGAETMMAAGVGAPTPQ